MNSVIALNAFSLQIVATMQSVGHEEIFSIDHHKSRCKSMFSNWLIRIQALPYSNDSGYAVSI